jgi:hypothetical protein
MFKQSLDTIINAETLSFHVSSQSVVILKIEIYVNKISCNQFSANSELHLVMIFQSCKAAKPIANTNTDVNTPPKPLVITRTCGVWCATSLAREAMLTRSMIVASQYIDPRLLKKLKDCLSISPDLAERWIWLDCEMRLPP